MTITIQKSLCRWRTRLLILYREDDGYVSEAALVTALFIGICVAVGALLGPAILELVGGIVAKLRV
ncbi:hypothetical protein JNUCC0626_13870 [Lentzea sp. JNUCC 0626]|uniref:hypothetical protein n=1 Tax=Lentzea sp. JNUCC 0626 TaxID=3367513 RepID=UPI00374A31F4